MSTTRPKYWPPKKMAWQRCVLTWTQRNQYVAQTTKFRFWHIHSVRLIAYLVEMFPFVQWIWKSCGVNSLAILDKLTLWEDWAIPRKWSMMKWPHYPKSNIMLMIMSLVRCLRAAWRYPWSLRPLSRHPRHFWTSWVLMVKIKAFLLFHSN